MIYTMAVMLAYTVQYYILKHQGQIFYWMRLA